MLGLIMMHILGLFELYHLSFYTLRNRFLDR